MELEKEKKDPKEAKSNGKMKSAASIPDNYVSILQLQERWMKDKERKQKEREIVQRGVKQQVNAVEEPRVKLKEMGYEVSAIVSKKDEDGGDSRKKKWSKKKVNKKNQGGPVEAVVKCGSNNNPVKEETQGEKVVQNRENAACNSIGVETQFKQRVEEGGRDRNVNGAVRLNSGKGYYRNQKHDWSSTRVIKATKTMVWVKKGGE
ncbi:uncharacterized protein LOC106419998 [Brassica napus]|uniref:(rape) hypothetical protein n=1 Tax=Brassica napus TaxID=3708 RepID=A0A816PUB7_BRANA|nr:uncharacterized protein LOC106419998 [Brassica napus]CAF2051939.1 unnamed protein product [Brassica napus]